MKYFEYQPGDTDIEAIAMSMEAGPNRPRFLASLFTKIVAGLDSILDLGFETFDFCVELSELTETKLRKVLQRRQNAIQAFIEHDELARGWYPDSTGYRSLLQIAMAYILARTGDAQATRRVLSVIRNGNSFQRFTALNMMANATLDHLGSVSPAWEKALSDGIATQKEHIEVIAEVAQEHSLTRLVPDLISAARALPIERASVVVSYAIHATADSSLRQRLASEFIPQLPCEQATLWFSRLSRSDEESDGDFRVLIAPLVNHIIEIATVEQLSEFLYHFRGRDFDKYATMDHVDAIQCVANLPNPDNEPNLASRIRRAKSVLAEIIPERDIQLILESGSFESVCRQLLGNLQATEIPQVLAGAQEALNQGSSFGPAACQILWNDCGVTGRIFVAKNVHRLPLDAIQCLIWLVEGHTVLSLAEAFVKAQLTSRTAKSIANAAKRKFGDSSGPDAFWQLLDVCKRFTAYDMESGEVPPDYETLIKDLCKGSAGALKCSSIRVSDDHEAPSWTISFRCLGEKIEYSVNNLGDWFAVGDTEAQLSKLARKAGLKDSYIFLGGDNGQCAAVAFAPAAKLKKLAKRVAIPVETDHPDDLEELREEWINRLKKRM